MRNYCSLSRFLNSSLALSIPHMADQCDKDLTKENGQERNDTRISPSSFHKACNEAVVSDISPLFCRVKDNGETLDGNRFDFMPFVAF